MDDDVLKFTVQKLRDIKTGAEASALEALTGDSSVLGLDASKLTDSEQDSIGELLVLVDHRFESARRSLAFRRVWAKRILRSRLRGGIAGWGIGDRKHEIGFYRPDSNLWNFRSVEELESTLRSLTEQFVELHKAYVTFLSTGRFVASHETLSEIHRLLSQFADLTCVPFIAFDNGIRYLRSIDYFKAQWKLAHMKLLKQYPGLPSDSTIRRLPSSLRDVLIPRDFH